MRLEAQVVSLALAQRLKALGVKQSAIFWWTRPEVCGVPMEGGYMLSNVANNWTVPGTQEQLIAAFTVAELGEMLRDHVGAGNPSGASYWPDTHGDGGWFLMTPHDAEIVRTATEADARGLLLCALIESGSVKP